MTDKVEVTQEDREAADTICNPVDNPHLYRILCKKFAHHRLAAFEAGGRAMQEAAASAIIARLDRPAKSRERPISWQINQNRAAIRAIDPASLKEPHHD